MKTLFLALCFSLSLLACNKNNNDNNVQDGHIAASQVPAPVLSSFNTRYASASGQIEWEIEHGNTYKVKFFIGSQRWQAQFTINGSFIDEQMIS